MTTIEEETINNEEELLQDTLPSSRQVQTDMLEWWCHVVLLNDADVHPALYSQRVQGLYDMMEVIGESVGDYGRAHNRLQLAILCAELCDRGIVPEEEEEMEEADIPLSQLSPEKWAEFRETLESIRNKLLRKDANCDESEEPNDEMDTDLEELPKFSIEYDGVMNLLEICEVVARFKVELEKLRSSKAKGQKYLFQKVETAVDDYKENIHQLQLGDELAEKLTSFLLADIYKKSKPRDLAQRLEQHLQEIMISNDSECGFPQVVLKTRRLLSRWHSHVLTVPKLCRLGYGGFVKRRKSSMVDTNETISVSSWGADEHNVAAEECEEGDTKQHVVEGEEEESEDDDLNKYETADDATADPDEVNVAFGLSTQPPIPEKVEKETLDSQDDEVDDGDKKPRAKRKKSQQEEEDQQGAMLRRSSRLMGDFDEQPRGSLRARKKTSSQASKSSPGAMGSNVYSEEDVSTPPRKKAAVARKPPPADNDSSSSSEEESSPPPRKKAAVARKPPPADDDSSSSSEEESSPPPRKKAAIARKPPPADNDSSSSSEEESSPRPPLKKAAVARRQPPPPRRQQAPAAARARAPKKNPTVIEWSESEDDESPPPAKRVRPSSFVGRRQSGGSGGKPKKQKKRRPFTDEEKQAIRDGVRRFGEGQWATIRLNSNGILLSRTNVNIKDCYRNMRKRGDV